MSVLIKGMEMPKNCWECRMVDTEFSFCHAMDSYPKDEGGHYVLNAEIPDWCPLVPVPPHGDLIDRDKLREKEFIQDGDAYAVVMSRDIRNAPTIIPAEEGET